MSGGGEPRPTGRALPGPLTRPRDAELPEAELRDALAGALIQALYQPIVRLADRRPMGLEVLARLEHPSHGTMSPGSFVPPMEDAGLGWPLTEAIMRRAFADWSGSRLELLDLTLALNLPLDVLLIPKALATLDRERAAAGIAAQRVVIELTESRPVDRLPEIRAATIYLRGLGYGLAIDDVGPQIRDHTPLLAMSFTSLKLDKDLVQQAPSDPATERFLLMAIASARQAGLKVVAEGVENQADWARMLALGVDFAQGFLVGHPLTAPEVLPWHRAWCDVGGGPSAQGQVSDPG